MNNVGKKTKMEIKGVISIIYQARRGKNPYLVYESPLNFIVIPREDIFLDIILPLLFFGRIMAFIRTFVMSSVISGASPS